ncbi:MAG TPA: allantoinase [Terriglobales bacterium]|nr:allantoinase [Terriglobales bacterium]
MADLVIRGGRVITPKGFVCADIAIEDGLFQAVAPELPGCAQEIDARGLVVFPGLLDVHLHFNEPGRTEWEGIATGSRALAAGGGTLFFDMPLNSSPCTLDGASFDLKRAAMEQSSATDFGLWGGLTPESLDTLDEMAERGAIGFKAFMSDSGLPEFARADDLTLYKGMQVAARWGLPVAVHAESEELTRGLAQKARAKGGCGVRDYLQSRPVLAELEAIQRAALLAKEAGAKLHIVHVSSGSGVVLAHQLRAAGADVTIETCPHYLFFTEDDMERLGGVAKCAPPLRSADERAELWSSLLRGEVDIVASDHSPAEPRMKQDQDFFRVWGGIAGVQSTLNVLLESGHHERGLPLETIAQLTGAAPARRFGISSKGEIRAGLDADCTLVATHEPFVLEAERLCSRHRASPYVGATFRGMVRRTILRGKTIFQEGAMAAPGTGKMVRPQSARGE